MSRLQYSTDIRLMRVMCTGRIDLSFILRAFAKGADGVFIGGCHLNECNYTTHGNFYALRISHICKKLMDLIGVNPDRLKIEFISGGEGIRFAEIMNDFSNTIRVLGSLGEGEGIDEDSLQFNLAAANKLVPYIKLLERERFRVQYKNREEYDEYFSSDEFDKLFKETVAENLAISQIVLLLQKGPLPTREISNTLGIPPAEVSRHLGKSSRQGLVRYDEGQKSYAVA